ncbi:MAG TPA: glycoside hydrolase family 13 protein [Cellulomonas sp.]
MTAEHRTAHDDRWWRTAVIYQVYPRSFADSDGDGVGDLPGITARLDHLSALGVDALWLSPFYRSPQVDAGYDVMDYCDVDPRFGTLADFDALLDRAHGLGIRIVVDIVPNHCSEQHPRFQAALAAGPGSPERDWFVFRDGLGAEGTQPPTAWPGTDHGSMWTRVSDSRGDPEQWYLHIFDKAQPDWNWEHPGVQQMFDAVLRFWLDRGVDGFRVDVAHGLVKQAGLPEYAPGPPSQVIPTADPATRPPMWDQDGVHVIHRRWRRVVDEYPGRILVAEAWLPLERARLYVRPDEMHQSFNFSYMVASWTTAGLRQVIDASLRSDGLVGAPTTWVLSNHDVVRHATRLGYPVGTVLPYGIGPDDPQPDRALGLRRARAATLLMLALPGSAYLYQGEELGLPEVTSLPDDVLQDYVWFATQHVDRGRDGCRVPLPWTVDGPTFGFGPTDRSWLPQPRWFADYAADTQEGTPGSTLELYRRALTLRRERRLGLGDVVWDRSDELLVLGRGDTLVVTNVHPHPVCVELPAAARLLLASDAGTLLPVGTDLWAAGAARGEPAGDDGRAIVDVPGDTTWWLSIL